MNATTSHKTSGFNFEVFHKIIGHLFFATLFIYACVYAVERITYVDSAWLAFERINGETFSFPGDRFAAFFSQIPLYLATKFHLPFKALVYIFSTSYVLLYFLIWRICTYTLKSPVAGLVVMFGMFMGVREAFLHTVSETHQCFAYSGLLFALLSYNFNSRAIKYSVIPFTTLLVLYSHPLGIFTASFALGYFFVLRRELRNVTIYIVAFLILAFALLNIIHPPNVYDEAQYSALTSGSGSDSFLKSGALNFLKIHFTHFYWLPELAGLIVFVWLVFRREYVKSVVLLLGVVGYVLIAAITFRAGDSSIMIERAFLPACFMINLAMADLLFRLNPRIRWIPVVLVLFFTVFGIRYINAGCLMYKKRVAYLDALVQRGIKGENDKYILDQGQADKEKILVPWALGAETLIYSKFRYDRCVTITMEPEACPGDYARIIKELCLPVGELNSEYFALSDKPYSPLP
jgi:hypothetical protein